MKTRLSISIIALLLIVVACHPKSEFEAYHSLKDSGWHKDSVQVFAVGFNNTRQSHNLYINIRNKGQYEFSNIWLFINIQSPDGENLTDTVEFKLADTVGRWTGSGIGDLFDNQFLYKENVFFPVPGVYKFSIQQGMRAKRLKGIRDIGIRIEKRN